MRLGQYDMELPEGVICALEANSERVETLSFSWTPGLPTDAFVGFSWCAPVVDIAYQWFPGCGFDRGLRTDWYADVHSRLSSSAPLCCFFGEDGGSRLTIALSDARTDLSLNFGAREEDGCLRLRVRAPLQSFDRIGHYEISLYTDARIRPIAEATGEVVRWWESLGMTPAPVPDAARRPLYSAWYSYHQATYAADIEAECAQAAKFGLDTIIVDDGWQTDDGKRGYGYCGDWEPAPSKIPDMRAHVARVHELGLRYVLWYSVPFLGHHAKAWPRFSGMLLDDLPHMDAGVLDPRYPEVRAYLTGTYTRAIRDWNLDGFKLDFIDAFRMGALAKPYGPGMDIPVLEDAVNALMTGIRAALTAIRPDILIEFRQSYIGPMMRAYGNMFRVGDCPMCLDKNRVGMVDLRLTSGNTAVHSDMLMWHPDDGVENAARQLLNVLFCVPQISMRLAELPDAHRWMLSFWLDFIREHRDLLLDAPLYPEMPQYLYPTVSAGRDGRYVVAAYETGRAVSLPGDAREVYLVNATALDRLIVRLDAPAHADVERFDVTGERLASERVELQRLNEFQIPVCGLSHILLSR